MLFRGIATGTAGTRAFFVAALGLTALVLPFLAEGAPATRPASASGARPATMPTTASASMPAGRNTFQPVLFPKIASTFAITEDGRHLVVAHQDDNCITVWDILSGRLLKEIATPSPRFILCRGPDAYVVNFGKAVISVFNRQKDWAKTGELLSGHKDVDYLSAAGGRWFDGRIYATARVRERGPRNGWGMLFEADANAKGVRLVRETTQFGFESVSYRGRYAAKPLGLLVQPRDGLLWIGEGGIYAGTNPSVIRPAAPSCTLPDLRLPIAYVLEPDAKPPVVRAISLEDSLREIGSLELGAGGSPPRCAYVVPDPDEQGSIVQPVQAVTLEQSLFFFAISRGKLLRLCVRAFDSPADREANAPLSASAPARKSPPAVVAEGRRLLYELAPSEANASCTLLKGPAGAILSGATLSWTPGKDQIGPQDFKIRCAGGGTVEFLRFQIEVVPAETANLVRGGLSNARDAGTHYILEPQFCLAPAWDRKSLLLLQGQVLSVLDEEARVELSRAWLPETYQLIADRRLFYVALREGAADLIDKTSLKVLKTIPLDCRGVSDLALHPREPVFFVAGLRGGGSAACPILRVEEPTGLCIRMPGVDGLWLAMHPEGNRLFVLGPSYDSTKALEVAGPRPPVRQPSLRCYAISKESLQLLGSSAVNYELAKGLGLSADGGLVACPVSGGKADRPQVAVFSGEDVSRPRLVCPHGATDPAVGFVPDAAFHGVLPLIATCTEKEVLVCNERTGRPLENAVDPPAGEIRTLARVWFTPGGRSLVVDCVNREGRRVLRALPLHLNKEDLAALDVARPRASSRPATAPSGPSGRVE